MVKGQRLWLFSKRVICERKVSCLPEIKSIVSFVARTLHEQIMQRLRLKDVVTESNQNDKVPKRNIFEGEFRFQT